MNSTSLLFVFALAIAAVHAAPFGDSEDKTVVLTNIIVVDNSQSADVADLQEEDGDNEHEDEEPSLDFLKELETVPESASAGDASAQRRAADLVRKHFKKNKIAEQLPEQLKH